MEETLGGNGIGSSGTSSLRMSRRSWASASDGDVFGRGRREDDEEEELKWAALERLPSLERMRKGVLKQVSDGGRVSYEVVDIKELGMQEKKHLMERIFKTAEEDNERFLSRLRDRIDKVGIEFPKIEVQFEHLSVEGDAYIGTRALPSLVNSTMNALELL